MKTFRLSRWLGIGLVGLALMAQGCTRHPSQDDVSRLEENRAAAESAEKKLGELKTERAQLETTLQDKQAELAKNEQERDELKSKMGK